GDRASRCGYGIPRLSRSVIDELDEEDEFTGAVLSDLEKRVDRIEPGALREACRDLLACDPANRRDLDLSRRQRVAAPDLHVRSLPDANAASDLAALDPRSECLGEHHGLLPTLLLFEQRSGPGLLLPPRGVGGSLASIVEQSARCSVRQQHLD